MAKKGMAVLRDKSNKRRRWTIGTSWKNFLASDSLRGMPNYYGYLLDN
jgi:hypothetical protein